jgi:hypothetical protein
MKLRATAPCYVAGKRRLVGEVFQLDDDYFGDDRVPACLEIVEGKQARRASKAPARTAAQ